MNGERCAPSSFRSSSGHRPQAPRSMIRPTTFARKTDLETPFGWHTSSSASFGLGSSGSSRSLADFRPSATSTVQQDAGSRPVGRKFTTRKVNVVKFDGTQKSGRRSHIQQGAPWLIRCPAVCTVRRLTDLVKKKAISQGVSPDMEFILTDSSGYALQDDERPDVSRKILAAPRHNFERHFGECVSLAEQLSSRTPEGQKSEKRRSSSDSLGKRRLFSSSVTDSDTDDVDDRDLAESELDSARTKNQSSACRSKDSSTYSATSVVDQELGGHSSVEATVRNILQDANLPWLTYFVVDELREAFACPLCQDVLDQPVVCPDCQDVVGGVRCVNERLSTSEPVCPKNGCTNFVERRLQLKGRFDKILQRLQKYDVPLPAERNRPTVRCFER